MTFREIRKSKGYTLRQLAELSGVSYFQIQSIETGRIKLENISVKNFMALCKALEVDPWEIYGGKENA